MTPMIHIVTGCLLNDDQQLLVVRKRDTEHFMLPGGKPLQGETPILTLSREWQEALGASLNDEALAMLGRFRAKDIHENDMLVDADVFVVEDFTGHLQARAEIAEVRWIALDDDTTLLAPLLSDEVLSALRKRFD